MEKWSISNWMKSFYYGRPIASRLARTAAGHYRIIVGVLVVSLFVLHLIYLFLSPSVSWPLVKLLVISIVFYSAYVVARMRIPARWESRYYTPHIQMIRAQLGILGTALLLLTFTWFEQANLLWILFILPIMIVSEHCSTNQLLGVLAEIVVILLGAAWLEGRQPMPVFLQSTFAFRGLAQGVTVVLMGFLLHYTMRNLDARDQTIDRLRDLLIDISRLLSTQRDPKTIHQTSLELFIGAVDAQCGALWVADRRPGILRLAAFFCPIDDQARPVCLTSPDGSVNTNVDVDEESLPARVMRTGIPHCISQSGKVPAALADATLDVPPLFSRAAVEIGVPVKVFQLHKPESVAVLTVDLDQPVSKEELRRVYLTAVEVAGVLSPLFYFASLMEELWALRDLSQAVSHNVEQMPVIDALLEIVTDTLGFDFAIVSLVDEVKQTIAAVQGYNVPQTWLEKAMRPLESDGIQADIIRTGKTEILSGWDDRFDRRIWEAFGHEKMLRIFLPMEVADPATGQLKRIGTVEAGYWKADQVQSTQVQVEFLQPFVAQAAVAVYKAQLYEQARWRADGLERLHDVGQTIQKAVWRLPRLMKEIGNSALKVLHADIVFLYGYNQNAHRIELLHTAGEVWGQTPLSPHLGEGNILDWIIERRRPFYTCDAQNAPELVGYGPSDNQHARYRTFTQRQDVQAFAGIPLLTGERLIGIMCVNYRCRHRFSDDVKHIIELFAQLAAVALENSRLKEMDKELALQKERSHLSRELHDAVVQDLYGLSLKARAWLQEPDIEPATETRLKQFLALAEGVNCQIGFIVSELRSPLLGSSDFCTTIRDTAERLRQFYGLAVSYQDDGFEQIEVPSPVNTALAHVAKEALTNAFRHAKARHITVRSWHRTSNDALCLEIKDDGIGFEPNRPYHNKHGLLNMREFAREVKGHLEIDSAPGQGCRVFFSVPLGCGEQE